MRIFDIIIVIITIIIIISFILTAIYFNNKISDNNYLLNKENLQKLEELKNDIDKNYKDYKEFKNNIDKNNYKLDDGEIVIFATDNVNKNKIIDVQVIKTKVYGEYINNYYSLLSTEPFYFHPRFIGDNYIYYLYGINLYKRGAYYTAPYNIFILDDKNEIQLLKENDYRIKNKNNGLITLSDGSNTSINYLYANNEITEGDLKENDVYNNGSDKIAKFKYLSSYILVDSDNKPLKLENKTYLMSFKDVYGIYPGAILEYLNKYTNKKVD